MIELSPRDNPAVGIEVVPFNWPLRRARERRGWSRAALAREIGVTPTTVGFAEQLRPVSATVREKIALTLEVPEDVLFPGAVDDALGLESVEAPPAEDVATTEDEHVHARTDIEGALDRLPPRQRRIVQMRYGMVGGPPATLGDIAEQFGLTPERIRQLEHEALRQLSRPLRVPDDAPRRPAATVTPTLRPERYPPVQKQAPAPRRPSVRSPVVLLRPVPPRPIPPPPVVFVSPLALWLRDVAGNNLTSPDRDIARAILTSECCRAFSDLTALRPHVAAEHVSDPSFWSLYDAFAGRYDRWVTQREGAS